MTNKGMVVSYQRVSSVGQNLDRQGVRFSEGNFDRHYTDKVSGVVPFAERPAGKRLVEDVEKGIIDEVHVLSVDRIGRSATDVITTMQYFVQKKVNVVIVKEGIHLLNENKAINPTASIVLSVMSAIAEIERNAIRERQLEGIAIAKTKGMYLGRRKGTTESPERFLSKPKNQRIVKLLNDGTSITHTARIVGVSPVTAIKVKKIMEAAVS